MITLQAPDGVTTAGVGQTVYTVENGVIDNVQPEHVAGLLDHGFTYLPDPAQDKPKKGKKAAKADSTDTADDTAQDDQ